MIPYHINLDSEEELHNALLLFIKTMDKVGEVPYILIYCHTGMNLLNRKYFNWFKSIWSTLPRKIRKNIKALYIFNIKLEIYYIHHSLLNLF